MSFGTIIQGKWHKREYRVERLLGEGANGKVYLVRRGKQTYALKIGFDTVDHQSEVNALKALSKSNTSFRHYLLDVDDFHYQGRELPFCVMRYVKGQTMSDFVIQRGQDWVYIIGTNLLRKLVELHGQRYIFGDLKVENMLVSGYGDVELIDFGGVTPMGRSVKQFTVVYDRGYWGGGSRSADEAYDLFAFAVLLISGTATAAVRKQGLQQVLPQNRNVHTLLDMLHANKHLSHVEPVLRKALMGQYASSGEALAEWRKQSYPRPVLAARAMRGSMLKLCFAASLLLFGFTVYLFWPLP
ncbi:serine/threonine protein kinase [Paenibacillus rigui]|uniref:non-specific serine/threonine protein kinase n=1 Tax=Paenibacillus rigui TaxID=554312 RepID=A0A229UGG8_9BACL|nr:serine/threonine protein kinase [Paenibacillus rigui]